MTFVSENAMTSMWKIVRINIHLHLHFHIKKVFENQTISGVMIISFCDRRENVAVNTAGFSLDMTTENPVGLCKNLSFSPRSAFLFDLQ
jgi:hypothetical protein